MPNFLPHELIKRENSLVDPLSLAIGEGNIQLIKKLLHNLPDINEKEGGTYLPPSNTENGELPLLELTYLMQAARTGRVQVLDALIAAGAEVNQQNNEGDTALCYAISWDNPQAFDILLEQGAQVMLPGNKPCQVWDILIDNWPASARYMQKNMLTHLRNYEDYKTLHKFLRSSYPHAGLCTEVERQVKIFEEKEILVQALPLSPEKASVKASYKI